MSKLKFGVRQIGVDSPEWLKVLANTVIILCAFVAWIVTPMPDAWICLEVKVYILTVTSSVGGMLKGIEKLTGEHKTNESTE